MGNIKQQQDISGKLVEFIREHRIEIDRPFKVVARTYIDPDKSRIALYWRLTTLQPGSTAYRAYMNTAVELLRDCKRNGCKFIKAYPLD
jgi:hypothetical protein